MAEFKVTGIEKEDEQEIFNGKDAIKEDEKNGLKEVNLECEETNVRIIFQETTIQNLVTDETSIDAETSSDIDCSVDLAENEIETIEVVNKFIIKTKDLFNSDGDGRN